MNSNDVSEIFLSIKSIINKKNSKNKEQFVNELMPVLEVYELEKLLNLHVFIVRNILYSNDNDNLINNKITLITIERILQNREYLVKKQICYCKVNDSYNIVRNI